MKKIIKQLKKIRKIHNQKAEIEERIEKRLSEISLNTEEINKLEEITKNFFPNHGSWSSTAYLKSEDSIYCHLRDDYWLAKELSKIIPEIELVKILKYVKTSEFFEQEKHNYEQRIITWQINFMMNRKEGWIADDLIDWMPNCDIKFRQAIIDTLVAIGIDNEAIEEGIEKNATIWREHYLNKAFNNTYDSPMHSMDFFGHYQGIELLPPLDEHKEKWIKLRKYEYYQRHLDSVTKYGNIEELVDLKMTIQDLIQLTTDVEIMHIERMAEIEKFKNEKENRVNKINVLKPIQNEKKYFS